MFIMDFKKIKEFIYEIPKSGKMNVPAVVYTNDKLLELLKEDRTLEQIQNVACLPGIIKAAYAMSDCHEGYGFPIGGVAAFDSEEGIVTPAGVGYDINCSVRLLKTNLKKKDIIEKQKKLSEVIFKKIPAGVGRGSQFQISRKDFPKVLEGGAQYVVERGYGVEEDYLHTEECGKLKGADVSKVSARAFKRGLGQLGSLGAGNHFLEIGYVEKIFDKEVAERFGLKKNSVTIMIHCGSRGLGHQIASDYIKAMEEEYGVDKLPDKDLVYAPIKSSLGKDCLSAMYCATNWAFANKQIITHWAREGFEEVFGKCKIDVVYDVCHNIAKFERHKIDGKWKKVLIHRKGATRSFGPGREEIPEKYRDIGQPVIIPGSMGTSSYVLVGTEKAEEISFGSTVHGSGRSKSRSKALKEYEGKKIQKELREKGILVGADNFKRLGEEAPGAYKDVDEVIKVVDGLGISKKVAKLKPLIVLK